MTTLAAPVLSSIGDLGWLRNLHPISERGKLIVGGCDCLTAANRQAEGRKSQQNQA